MSSAASWTFARARFTRPRLLRPDTFSTRSTSAKWSACWMPRDSSTGVSCFLLSAATIATIVSASDWLSHTSALVRFVPKTFMAR